MFGSTTKGYDATKHFGPGVNCRLPLAAFSQARGFFTQPSATAGLLRLPKYPTKEAAG